MGRANKNKRLYRCLDCGESQYLHWTETRRASRPKCWGCGSTRLEISKLGGKAQAAGHAAGEQRKAGLDQHGSGSVAPASG